MLQVDPFVDLNQVFHVVEDRNGKSPAERMGKNTQVVAQLAAVICRSGGLGDANDAQSSYSTLVRASECGGGAHSGRDSMGSTGRPWLLVMHCAGRCSSVLCTGTNWSGAIAAMIANNCQPMLLLYELQGRDCRIPPGRGRFDVERSSHREPASSVQQHSQQR